jgi:spermidine synthase
VFHRHLNYDGHMPLRAEQVNADNASNLKAAQPVPVVSDKDGVLTLHFGSDYIQSQMRVNQPDYLALAYTRTMMAFEIFLPKPRSIALIGLGGGSIAKWCLRHHPDADLKVVEINPHVIAVREAFGVPDSNEKFQILCEDGARFLAQPPNPFDVLLIDCFTSETVPPELSSKLFFDNCRAALTSQGLMVANLCWKKHRGVLARIRKSFRGQILESTDRDGNTVVFACKGDLLWPADESENSFRLKLRKFQRKYSLGRAMTPR